MKKFNPTQDVLEYIRKHPGAHTSRIASDLGFAWSTINYHVNKLVRQGKVTWHTTSGRNGLFSSSLPKELGASMAVLVAPDRFELLRAIREAPGQSLTELLQSFQVSRKVLRKDLSHLESTGCVERTYGHRGKYYITKHGSKILDEKEQQIQSEFIAPKIYA